ncbi:HdeD family acid-resistance protein [Brumimicrobium oceani]|uniref:HdeD family acid-resistance protein n=1 Tax=Brumimicrobium oceani TaxID=2100725 RepID=A0A2U2XCQ3_9FLAO|nr:HdeD family acid-resistance protein [Brumimicrobium oceani]PWH85530.1 hypothetical protein DIT68_09555 [Brumimicrobium oceani]
MSNSIFKSLTNTVKNWYIPLIVGVLFIGAGIFTFASPISSYLALSLLFSTSFLVSGMFEVIFAISNRKSMDNWGWTLVFGLVTFFFGLSMTMQPAFSMFTLAVFVGITLLFRSIAAISFAIEIKNYGVGQWGFLLGIGIIGAIFSFILLVNPVFAGATIVTWTAISFIAVGVFSIVLSLRLRKVKHISKKISKGLRDRFEAISKEIREEIYD